MKPDTTWFNAALTNWNVNECGGKPTTEQLQVPLYLGKRPGNEALHIAMCLRKGGCTVRQFQIAGSCGPANNYRRRLVREGLFDETVEGKPYAYKLVVTAKGTAALAKAAAAAKAKDVAKGKPKAKKAVPAKPEAQIAPVPAPEAVTA